MPLPLRREIEHVLQAHARPSETRVRQIARLRRRRRMYAVENRRRVGMLPTGKYISTNARTPNFVHLMLKLEARQEIAGTAGLRSFENRKFGPSSVGREAGALKLDPAHRPIHGRIRARDIIRNG